MMLDENFQKYKNMILFNMEFKIGKMKKNVLFRNTNIC